MSRGTTVRKFRAPDETWEPAMAKARAEGADLSTVLRVALEDFLVAPPREWTTVEPGKASRPSDALLEALEGPA